MLIPRTSMHSVLGFKQGTILSYMHSFTCTPAPRPAGKALQRRHRCGGERLCCQDVGEQELHELPWLSWAIFTLPALRARTWAAPWGPGTGVEMLWPHFFKQTDARALFRHLHENLNSASAQGKHSSLRFSATSNSSHVLNTWEMHHFASFSRSPGH